MSRNFIWILCYFLVGCGGGGGGGTPVPIVVVPPPTPTLSVTFVSSSNVLNVTDVSSVGTFKVDATYTGDSTDPIVPTLTLDSNYLSLEGTITQSGKTYSAIVKSKEGLSAKQYKSTVQFRLCKDVACTSIYPGSTQSFEHIVDVKISDWTTRQRNAAHDGFVRILLDPAKFSKSWEWAPSNASVFEPVAARSGRVFLTQTNKDGSTTAYAINGSTGAEEWRYGFGALSHGSGPAIVGDQVVFSTMFTSSSNNPMSVLNATTGQFVRNFPFPSQWSRFAQPTPSQDNVFMSAGYYGNVVYGFDLKAGAATFTANGSGGKAWDGQAPAADSRYVYYYSGNLDVIDRTTGALVKSIPDPFWSWSGYSYGATPMLGSPNNVIAFSGTGQGTYNVSFPLVNFDVQAGVHKWRTADLYSGTPAVAKGVVYAASNQLSQLSAIDEATGKILWAWPLPAGQQFVENIIVTENLLFLSTTSGIYAIDLAGTHQTLWTAATPGSIAITPDAKLVVVPVRGAGLAKITSYSLQ